MVISVLNSVILIGICVMVGLVISVNFDENVEGSVLWGVGVVFNVVCGIDMYDFGSVLTV